MTASIGKQGRVIPASMASEPRIHNGAQVFHAEYRGDPLVSFCGTEKKFGGLIQFKASRLETELETVFVRIADVVRQSHGQETVERGLQIKVIAPRAYENRIRKAAANARLDVHAFGAYESDRELDCFFYTETGRLRVGPIQTARDVTRVLIVDDSKTMRKLLRKIIDESGALEVVGEAERPSQVEGLLEDLKPDVMTLDINMPEMSGVDLLKNLLPKRFIPTVMISSLNMEDGDQVLSALELGAVDYIHKPAAHEMAAMAPLIREKLVEASRVRPNRKRDVINQSISTARALRSIARFENSRLIAIGASTGGTEAIKNVFQRFPAQTPPIVVVQHIPPYFSTAFANRLNQVCPFEVREAQDGDELRPGLALIAPGGRHMEVVKRSGRLVVSVFDGEPVNRFKPSVDVLFKSVAKTLGAKSTGVLLTGMGSDGARGLLEMKSAGAFTIAQDQDSCVVFGMPRAAIEMGAAMDIKPLEAIPESIMKAA